jgi:hypothetical protein
MHLLKLRVLGVVGVRAADEVFEQEEVARAALDDCEQPVAQLELPAAWIGLLGKQIGGEGGAVVWIGVTRRRGRGEVGHDGDGGWEGRDEGVVEGEVREVGEQDGGEGRWVGEELH